jgi:hypothetical protein
VVCQGSRYSQVLSHTAAGHACRRLRLPMRGVRCFAGRSVGWALRPRPAAPGKSAAAILMRAGKNDGERRSDNECSSQLQRWW